VSEPEKKKRLPVLQDRVDDEIPPEDRPANQWVLASAVVTLLTWLILAGTGNAIVQRASPQSLTAMLVANVGALFAASAVAGAVTARLGKKAQRKHATWGAMITALFGWLLGFSQAAAPHLPVWLLSLALLVGIAWSGAYAGHRLASKPKRSL